jgi:aspartate aminotransferase-like enzyme
MVNHRGSVFKEKLPQLARRLQPIFGTTEQIYMVTGSGTAGMEMAVANLVSPGTPVLCLVGGFFGQRWAEICRVFGAEVHELTYPWDTAVNPDQVGDYLRKHPEIEVVFATHNESSTTVLNDIEAVAQARGDHQALLVVDAVSSLGGVPFAMDKWGVDVVVTASQKCLKAPPGLAFVSFSSRAKEKAAANKSRSYYFDLAIYDRYWARHEPPFTPSISLLFAVEEALNILEAEGLESAYARHRLMRDMVRAGVRALGLVPLVADEHASPTVTGVKLDGADEWRTAIRARYGVEFAGGQGPFAGKIFRIGHMGYATPLDMLTSLAVLEMSFAKPGAATTAAELVWSQTK